MLQAGTFKRSIRLQRTELENIIVSQVRASQLRYFFIRGIVSKDQYEKNFNGTNILNAKDLQTMIEQSEIILARSGYSTIKV